MQWQLHSLLKSIEVSLNNTQMTKLFAKIVMASVLLSLLACSSTPPVVRDGLPADHASFRQNKSEPVPQSEAKARYGNKSPYTVLGKKYYVMAQAEGYSKKGIASWYGTKFHGRLTSSREPYDMYAFTAAHKTLPLPSYVEVTNLANNKTIVVRVNDRGPFKEGRIIDLSYAAARKLDMVSTGTAKVKVTVVSAPTSSHTGAIPIGVAGDIYIQMGAFSSRSNAELLANQVKSSVQQADKVTVTPVRTGAGRVYRVRLGPMETAVQADKVIDELLAKGFDHPNVVVEK